jgi:hypothetical protein
LTCSIGQHFSALILSSVIPIFIVCAFANSIQITRRGNSFILKLQQLIRAPPSISIIC